jgi:hypothetical protein
VTLLHSRIPLLLSSGVVCDFLLTGFVGTTGASPSNSIHHLPGFLIETGL